MEITLLLVICLFCVNWLQSKISNVIITIKWMVSHNLCTYIYYELGADIYIILYKKSTGYKHRMYGRLLLISPSVATSLPDQFLVFDLLPRNYVLHHWNMKWNTHFNFGGFVISFFLFCLCFNSSTFCCLLRSKRSFSACWGVSWLLACSLTSGPPAAPNDSWSPYRRLLTGPLVEPNIPQVVAA